MGHGDVWMIGFQLYAKMNRSMYKQFKDSKFLVLSRGGLCFSISSRNPVEFYTVK